jgi:hypothetical protein
MCCGADSYPLPQTALQLRFDLGIADLEARASASVKELSADQDIMSKVSTSPAAAGAEDAAAMAAHHTAIALRLASLTITGSTSSAMVKKLVDKVIAPPPAAAAIAPLPPTRVRSSSAASAYSSASGFDEVAALLTPIMEASADADSMADAPSLFAPVPAEGAAAGAAVTPSATVTIAAAGAPSSGAVAAAAAAPTGRPALAAVGATGAALACREGPLSYVDQDSSTALDEVVAEMLSLAFFFQVRVLLFASTTAHSSGRALSSCCAFPEVV